MISLLGTETDFFAGYRACPCLKDHYRTHLLKGCHECGKNGLVCQGEYASLKPGYWWQWCNHSYKSRYQEFIQNLIAAIPALDENSVKYPYPLPTPYMCQVPDSCEGGMDSPCADGYEGPVCAICSLDYYKQSYTCKKIPSKSWIAGQLSRGCHFISDIFLVGMEKEKKASHGTWSRSYGQILIQIEDLDRILPSHLWVTERFFLQQVARFFRHCCKVLRDTST